jgi:hypothetical protein
MAFSLYKDTYNVQTERLLLKENLTFKVGDVVAVEHDSTNNVAVLTNEIAYINVNPHTVVGVLQGFATNTGGIFPPTGQDTSKTPQEYTTSSTNLTSEKVNGVYIPIHSEQVWLADLNVALGTTSPLSGSVGSFYNLSDARTVDETTYIAPTNPQHLVLVGRYVENGSVSATKALFRFTRFLYKNN